jgi:hypothetical protein
MHIPRSNGSPLFFPSNASPNAYLGLAAQRISTTDTGPVPFTYCCTRSEPTFSPHLLLPAAASPWPSRLFNDPALVSFFVPTSALLPKQPTWSISFYFIQLGKQSGFS